jgi:hypothetical protein
VSSTEPEKLILSGAERELATRLSENPMDLFQGKSIGWLEDFIRITVGSNVSSILTSIYGVGHYRIVAEDLTAQTSEYVYSDAFGDFLYMNGVAVSQSTYASLYAEWGANKWAADSGGNFSLGDARGRGLFMCGTHANAGFGDNDGVAVASRQAKHAHTNGATITGAPGAGTLAVASHVHPGVIGTANANLDTGATTIAVSSGTQDTGAAAPAVTGAPDAGTLAVGGTIGTGTSGDAPAHLFIGSLLVRF